MSALGLHDHKATEGFRLLSLRQAIALPIYPLSLILDFASVALGRLAAKVAGDQWPG
jgi:hypothetical protein